MDKIRSGSPHAPNYVQFWGTWTGGHAFYVTHLFPTSCRTSSVHCAVLLPCITPLDREVPHPLSSSTTMKQYNILLPLSFLSEHDGCLSRLPLAAICLFPGASRLRFWGHHNHHKMIAKPLTQGICGHSTPLVIASLLVPVHRRQSKRDGFLRKLIAN